MENKEIPEIEFNNLAKKCIRICKELYENKKFTNEGNVEERAKKYEERSNPVLKFIKEEYIEQAEEFVVYSDFVKKFNIFLTKNRLREQRKKDIKKSLLAEGFQIRDKQVIQREDGFEVDRTHTIVIWGLKLKDEDETQETF